MNKEQSNAWENQIVELQRRLDACGMDGDIIFEYDEYQFINEVVNLCSIDELKSIIAPVKKCVAELTPYSYAKEYFRLRVDFALCTIEYELPNRSYTCYVDGDKLLELLEKYVYKYEHLDDWLK